VQGGKGDGGADEEHVDDKEGEGAGKKSAHGKQYLDARLPTQPLGIRLPKPSLKAG
jgi:hypothetical protein